MTFTFSFDSASVIDCVATTNRPSSSEVIEALLSKEKALKKTPVNIPLAAIEGTWQSFFVFLWAGEKAIASLAPEVIAARGRGGGLAVWVKAE